MLRNIYRTFRTRTMLSMRRFADRSKQQLEKQAATGEYDELQTLAKRQKSRRFGHVSRSSGFVKTILQGTVKGKRRRDRQKKRWKDNIKEWTGMDFASSVRAAETGQSGKGLLQIHLRCHLWCYKIMG